MFSKSENGKSKVNYLLSKILYASSDCAFFNQLSVKREWKTSPIAHKELFINSARLIKLSLKPDFF